MYCQVIVDIVHENVARAFTYAIPEEMKVSPGQRVAVPFGSREKEGYVLALSEETEYDPLKIRAVKRTLEDYPAILPPMMELAREMAEKNHCPLAETLRLMIPAEMRGGRIRVLTEEWIDLTDEERARAAWSAESRSRKRKAILEMLMTGHPRRLAEIRERVPDSREALNKLETAGLIIRTEQEILRRPGTPLKSGSGEWHQLTPEQEEALEEILPAMRNGEGRFLLHGVTGSGKTEVFLAAARKALEDGKKAIILVPEIALTPQMVSWFQARFGTGAAVIHSRLSAGERFDEWRRIRRGEARIIIGARSAVFAPAENLGLIVVDEEHETTYQSDHHPRYDAREVARSRCDREGATLILASATPSILSFAKARRGDYMLLEMPRRVQDRPMPEVQLVDMRTELETGNRSVLSRALSSALISCMQKGEQAMLLINRRGYHSFVSCRKCGYVVKCPNCDVSMTIHVREDGGESAGENLLRCHYCGKTLPLPTRCPECGSAYIRYFGAGTQKVDAEVKRLFPGTPTARMDVDTTGGKDGHARILETFRSGRARILTGTQMIAKGLDFPQVTLVGVIAADMTLNLPDYRSRERTFQLLTQVAGRAGRGGRPGRVIIQTYKPEDPVIQLAARQDYRAFFEQEFARRRISLYPPFTALARVLVEAGEERAAEETAGRLAEAIRRELEARPAWRKKVLMMVAEAPGIKFLRGLHRRQILFKLLTGRETEELCGWLTELAEGAGGEALACFELNPISMI